MAPPVPVAGVLRTGCPPAWRCLRMCCLSFWMSIFSAVAVAFTVTVAAQGSTARQQDCDGDGNNQPSALALLPERLKQRG